MTEAQDECWLHPGSSLVLGMSLEQLPEVSVGSQQRPLPYFPFLPPSSSFFRAAAPRGSFLAAGRAGSAWPGAAPLCPPCPPQLLPLHPCPDPAVPLAEIFSPKLHILLLFFGEKAVVVSLGLSHGSSQELPVAFLWEQPCCFSCTFEAFPRVASEDAL